MPASPRLSARWRGRLLILAALYFTFLGGTFVTDLSFWPRVAHHMIVTAILAGWVISLWARRVAFPATALDLPLVAVLGSWIAATIFAVDPRVSAESLWQIFVHVMFLYILVDMMRRWGAHVVLEPIFFCAAVVVMVGLFEFASWYFGLGWLPMFRQGWPQVGGLAQPIPPDLYRLSFTLNVSTSLSGYLALLIPVGLAWAISTTSVSVRRGLIIWLGGAVIVEVLTFSRGGLLSLGVASAVFITLLFTGIPEWRARVAELLRKWSVRAALVIALALALVVLYVSLKPGDPFGHAAGDLMRRNLLDAAWQIGLSHPATGVGPYGFGRAMRQFRDPLVTGDYFTSAHNIPLQWFAESGVIGLAALAWLLLASGRFAWARWCEVKGVERIRIAGILAALVGFAAQNLADTLINSPLMLPCLALVAYLLAPVDSTANGIGFAARRLTRPVLSLVVVASAAGWAAADIAQYHFYRALTAGASGDLRTAMGEVANAERLDPAMGFYAAQRAQYLGQLAATDNAYLPDALDQFTAVVRRDGSYALLRANHAILLAQSNELIAASDEMKAAIADQPDEPRYWLAAAVFNEHSGIDSGAIVGYLESLELRPGWIASTFWDMTPLRSTARHQFMAAHGLDQTWTPGRLALIDPACWPAVPPLNHVPNASREALCQGEISLRINSDPSAALPELNQAVAASGSNPLAYDLRAEAYRLTGEADRAERDARTALFLGDTHAYFILGKLAEGRGDELDAEKFYQAGQPLVFGSEGWDVAVYQRRGDLAALPQFDAPGPSRYDFAAWFALIDLYKRLGRQQEAQKIRDEILQFDPFFVF